MPATPLIVRVAQEQDAATWLRLQAQAYKVIPHHLAVSDQVALFLAASPEQVQHRFLCCLGEDAIACWRFTLLESVVGLHDFFVLPDYVLPHGSAILSQIITLAKECGSLLTIEHYPELYSQLLLQQGFQQHERTRMQCMLKIYQVQLPGLPSSVRIRHPQPKDEEALYELTYQNYLDTIDEVMVSTSKAQAASMIRSIFGREYNLFDPECSFVVEDEQSRLIGSIFLGDESTPESGRLIWITDLSVDSAWRGRGVGRGLLLSALNAARIKGYERIGLTVTVGNRPAQQLYRSCGFQEYDALMYEAFLHLV